MKQFTDNAGRTWTIAINVSAIKRVRDLLKIDLLEIVEGALLERLIRDPVLLCDVVYVVCKPEADTQGVDDEDFGRALAGDAIERATVALLEDLADFSPSPRDRANLKKVLEQTWRAMDLARELVTRKLDSGALERAIAQALGNVGESFGVAPESPASNPTG